MFPRAVCTMCSPGAGLHPSYATTDTGLMLTHGTRGNRHYYQSTSQGKQSVSIFVYESLLIYSSLSVVQRPGFIGSCLSYIRA